MPVEHLVHKVHVRHVDELDDPEEWTANARASHHFVVRWHFDNSPELEWNARQALPARDLKQCDSCVRAKEADDARRKEFSRDAPSLRVLDVFAGTGAMSLGLVEGFLGKMKLTHAIEISPSAAKSLKCGFSTSVRSLRCT